MEGNGRSLCFTCCAFLMCCLCCLCRAKYDVEVNTVRINIHFASDYSFVKGALAKVTVCVRHIFACSLVVHATYYLIMKCLETRPICLQVIY